MMEENIMENGKIIICMEKAYIHGLMVGYMTGNIEMIKKMFFFFFFFFVISAYIFIFI